MRQRITLPKGLAIAGLLVSAVYFIDEVAKEGGTLGGFLPISSPMARGVVFQLSTLALSAAAFAISWNRSSRVVSIALVATGALMVIDGLTIGTRYFAILVVPGPIIGFTYGLAVLALGVVKTIRNASS